MKRRYDIEDVVLTALVFLVLATILSLVGYGIAKDIYKASAQADCLAQGYPEARLDWKFNAYCVSYDFRTTVKK